MIPSSGIQLDFPAIDEIYLHYAGLTTFGKGANGLLLLYRDLNCGGLATAMASNVAGVASLGIEADGAVARLALRSGVCDFVVNSLDEALRILKNEVRQLRAASVVVTEEIDTAVAEVVARGVQPDILAFASPTLMERGSKLLSIDAGEDHEGMLAITWDVQREPSRWLPPLDKLAAEALAGKDSTQASRVRWLEASPRYLGRMYAGQRYVRMTPEEAEGFLAAVEAAVKAGEVQVAVHVQRGGQGLIFES